MTSTFVESNLALSRGQREALDSLGAQWTEKHRREYLTEQGKYRLDSQSGSRHYCLNSDGRITHYAQATPSESSLEIEFLGDDVNDLIFEAILKDNSSPGLEIAVWLHGRLRGSAPPFEGFALDRTILRLIRPLSDADRATTASPVPLRTFTQGADDRDWVALNRRVFSGHPEQGSVDQSGFNLRASQSWFQAQGFFLAEEAGELVGFCWTKIHDDPWGAVGEIYAIGVDALYSGRGIAQALLQRAFRYFVDQEIPSAMLYCESDNQSALRLYQKMGFREQWCDERWVSNP